MSRKIKLSFVKFTFSLYSTRQKYSQIHINIFILNFFLNEMNGQDRTVSCTLSLTFCVNIHKEYYIAEEIKKKKFFHFIWYS